MKGAYVGQDDIESRYAISSHEEKRGIVDFEDFANFAACDFLHAMVAQLDGRHDLRRRHDPLFRRITGRSKLALVVVVVEVQVFFAG